MFIIIAIISEIGTLILFLKGLLNVSLASKIEVVIEKISELISINLFLYSFLLTLKRNRFKS